MSAPKMIQYVSSKEYLFGDLSRPCAGNTGAVFYYNFLILCLTFSHISDRIKTTKRKENEIEGKEGTSHQKRNDLPKTILRKERYRPPKT